MAEKRKHPLGASPRQIVIAVAQAALKRGQLDQDTEAKRLIDQYGAAFFLPDPEQAADRAIKAIFHEVLRPRENGGHLQLDLPGIPKGLPTTIAITKSGGVGCYYKDIEQASILELCIADDIRSEQIECDIATRDAIRDLVRLGRKLGIPENVPLIPELRRRLGDPAAA